MSEKKADDTTKKGETRAGEPDIERPPPVLPSKVGATPPDIFAKPTSGNNTPITDERTEFWKPTLLVQVVHFHEGDREDALDLGRDLYATLTRPPDEPLAFGAGVPVMMGVDPAKVDPEAARHVIVVCALGHSSANTKTVRETALKTMASWRTSLGQNHVIPVAFHANWWSAGGKKTGVVLSTERSKQEDGRYATLIAVSQSIARILSDTGSEPALFISHAKADIQDTDGVAETIRDYVGSHRGKCFFDNCDLTPGEDLEDQLDENLGDASVFVAVRSDSYSARAWCLQELLMAKRGLLPTLSVVVLRKGEVRSTSFGGNNPEVVWDPDDADCAQKVVLRAVVEWIRARLFEAEARRVHTIASLPELEVRNRAPELLDLSGKTGAEMLIYPDPELPLPERQVLTQANKRLHLTTPTSAYRYLNPDISPDNSVGNPLDGLQVGMSLSDSTDVYGKDGFTEHHFVDAVVYVTRCLVSAGAHIAYGGDFRFHWDDRGEVRKFGFTHLFIELIQSYSQTATAKPERLFSYLGSPIDPEEGATAGPINTTFMRELKPTGRPGKPLIPWRKNTGVPAGLYFSDMRRVMAQLVSATVLIGGQTDPKLRAKPKRKGERVPGYGGRYPGVVEEAWRMLTLGKPVYVAGGYGGAAGMVADLLEGKGTPKKLRDAHWMKHRHFKATAAKIDSNKWRKKLKLPRTMDDLGEAIRDIGEPLLANDKSSLAWNGLTRDENLALFRTRDPVEMAGLVLKGLLHKAKAEAKGKLEIELVRGDVMAAKDIDAISVPLYEGVPLGGAAGALDEVLGGSLHRALGDAQSVVAVKSPNLPVNWIHLAELKPTGSRAALPFDVAGAARSAVERAHRFGFRRLGLVLYGGTVLGSDMDKAIDAMVKALKPLAGSTKIIWYEADAKRFSTIQRQLKKSWKKAVKLTSRKGVLLDSREKAAVRQRAVLTVDLADDDSSITTMLIPPEGTGIARTRNVTVTPEQIRKLGAGANERGRSVPPLDELERRGKQLSRLLFGQSPDQFVDKVTETGLQITHNINASKIPFEVLATPGHPALVTETSVNRRLVLDGAQARELFAEPPGLGQPRALLIVNPTEDLDGAEREGDKVEAFLMHFAKVKRLSRDEATLPEVLKQLGKADLVHYCGHAFYEGPGLNDSGLCLAGGKELTLSHVQQLSALPRMAFFNACEAGRVRGRGKKPRPARHASKAAAFAEFFLGGGVEAYVGTHWFVADKAAQTFAEVMYAELANRKTLSEAVFKARQTLYEKGRKDWANYILYGEGDMSFVA